MAANGAFDVPPARAAPANAGRQGRLLKRTRAGTRDAVTLCVCSISRRNRPMNNARVSAWAAVGLVVSLAAGTVACSSTQPSARAPAGVANMQGAPPVEQEQGWASLVEADREISALEATRERIDDIFVQDAIDHQVANIRRWSDVLTDVMTIGDGRVHDTEIRRVSANLQRAMSVGVATEMQGTDQATQATPPRATSPDFLGTTSAWAGGMRRVDPIPVIAHPELRHLGGRALRRRPLALRDEVGRLPGHRHGERERARHDDLAQRQGFARAVSAAGLDRRKLQGPAGRRRWRAGRGGRRRSFLVPAAAKWRRSGAHLRRIRRAVRRRPRSAQRPARRAQTDPRSSGGPVVAECPDLAPCPGQGNRAVRAARAHGAWRASWPRSATRRTSRLARATG